LATLVVASTAAVGLVAPTAGAADGSGPSRVWVTHGLPLDDAGTVVDVFAGPAGAGPGAAASLIDDFTFGSTVGPVELPAAGYTVYVAAPTAGDDGALAAGEVVFSQDLAVPAGLDLSAVASLTADGTPTIAVFVNDLSAADAGEGRVSVRHTAAAPPVQLDATAPVAPWTWLGYWGPLPNGEALDLDLPAGEYDLLISVWDELNPVPVVGVDDFPVTAGALTNVYAVGTADHLRFVVAQIAL
jgi:hypothetical protein